ncbi:PRTRC system ThiF family protein [Pinibacter aurantiacus]|uniref:PRTRC system ThiF family protein n=1 Tax=Pinibacter aurantiacus TaxID=2851599 RepID=A0A9E2S9Q5_9BACT|nr:PRTRC system ThiF family protein [Pinibacter aurantiacus]MBV4357352.1 PRTRC system ThiF family protein [Pinibacter aurantiacus]
MTNEKTKVHFTDNYLMNATNPVTVNLIGTGGTGSKVLIALMEMNHSLIELGHAGLLVRLWDDDVITNPNIGRQRFAECEIGLNKSVALINRCNRWSGTNWKAETKKLGYERQEYFPEHFEANIFISCVDNVTARFEIADMLQRKRERTSTLKYWLDFGNSHHTGQVILSTIGTIRQPNSEKYETVDNLPFVTEEFGDLLTASEKKNDVPSCSLFEALEKQDLYINASLVQMGCSLLWNMFRNGLTIYRGFFHNLKDFNTHPIKIA